MSTAAAWNVLTATLMDVKTAFSFGQKVAAFGSTSSLTISQPYLSLD
jgi:hypothetical protein